jgi:hypothetical protein
MTDGKSNRTEGDDAAEKKHLARFQDGQGHALERFFRIIFGISLRMPRGVEGRGA